jgi:hypothetical protein
MLSHGTSSSGYGAPAHNRINKPGEKRGNGYDEGFEHADGLCVFGVAAHRLRRADPCYRMEPRPAATARPPTIESTNPAKNAATATMRASSIAAV